MTNTAKLTLSKLYRKASNFKKIQHHYLYFTNFHEYVERSVSCHIYKLNPVSFQVCLAEDLPEG